MRITIPDESLDILHRYVSPTMPLERLIEIALSRVGAIGPTERHLVLRESDINQLEERLGCDGIGQPKDLHRAVNQLADVEIEGISLRFSPYQLQELKDRAQREGLHPTELARRIVYAMQSQFFVTAPAEPPVAVGKPRKGA